MHDSDYDMTCTTTITSISNTLHKLLLQYDLHSPYNQTKYIGEEVIILNIFTTSIESLLKYIKHPAFIQQWKLNLDSSAYEKN